MTLADLLREIRQRANLVDANVPRAVALEAAALLVLEPCTHHGSELAKPILAALLGLHLRGGFNPALLDAMTPEVVLLLDVVLDGLTNKAVQGAVH
jgi:hypothetical protein